MYISIRCDIDHYEADNGDDDDDDEGWHDLMQ